MASEQGNIEKDVHDLIVEYHNIKDEVHTLDTKMSKVYLLSVVGIVLGCIKIYMEIG